MHTTVVLTGVATMQAPQGPEILRASFRSASFVVTCNEANVHPLFSPAAFISILGARVLAQ